MPSLLLVDTYYTRPNIRRLQQESFLDFKFLVSCVCECTLSKSGWSLLMKRVIFDCNSFHFQSSRIQYNSVQRRIYPLLAVVFVTRIRIFSKILFLIRTLFPKIFCQTRSHAALLLMCETQNHCPVFPFLLQKLLLMHSQRSGH